MKRIIIVLALTTLLVAAMQAVPRDMVIVEIGTGTWCQYCPGAAMGADDLVEQHHRAAIIENHNNDPYANTFSDARNSYYNISSWPSAYFDGSSVVSGGSNTASMFSTYHSRYNNKIDNPSKYTISAVMTHTGLVYNVAVTVTQTETDTNTNIKLHGVLTESGIQRNWQGQTHLEFVQRLMAPDQYGTDLDFSEATTQTVNLTFTALPAWNAENFEFVFFLQNHSTKEVLQGCKYTIQALRNDSPASDASLDFGTAIPDDMITRTFTMHNWWTQDMNVNISINGMDFFVMPQERETYTIPYLEDKVFDIVMMPSQVGTITATMTITTDNPAYPVINVPLTAMVTTANDDQNVATSPNGIISISPNPFSEFSAIKYNLKSTDRAELQIYNVKGAKVFTRQISNRTSAGQSVVWTGKDDSGKLLSSGIYFCKLVVEGKTVSTQKLVKVK